MYFNFFFPVKSYLLKVEQSPTFSRSFGPIPEIHWGQTGRQFPLLSNKLQGKKRKHLIIIILLIIIKRWPRFPRTTRHIYCTSVHTAGPAERCSAYGGDSPAVPPPAPAWPGQAPPRPPPPAVPAPPSPGRCHCGAAGPSPAAVAPAAGPCSGTPGLSGSAPPGCACCSFFLLIFLSFALLFWNQIFTYRGGQEGSE